MHRKPSSLFVNKLLRIYTRFLVTSALGKVGSSLYAFGKDKEGL